MNQIFCCHLALKYALKSNGMIRSMPCISFAMSIDSMNHTKRTFFSSLLWTGVHFLAREMSANKMRIDILLKSIRCCFVSYAFSVEVKRTKSCWHIHRRLLESWFDHTMRKKCLPFLLCDVKCCCQKKQERKRGKKPSRHTHSHGWNSSKEKEREKSMTSIWCNRTYVENM